MNYDKLFSTARMSSYRAISKNKLMAEKLYYWNIELSSAIYETLMLLEVALRNAIDTKLRTINCTLADKNGVIHSHNWILDPNQLIGSIISSQEIQKAIDRAKHHHTNPNQDDILAQMTFGNWRYILPSKGNSKKMLLWNNGLKDSFNLSACSLKSFSRDIQSLNITRNRIAHYEPLLEDNYPKYTMKRFIALQQQLMII